MGTRPFLPSSQPVPNFGIHCIVSAGGFDGKIWIDAKRKNNRFLFPQASLAAMFKAMFMEVLEKDFSINWNGDKNSVLKTIGFKKWNVYAKAPFGSPDRVVEYMGRYLPSGHSRQAKCIIN